MRCFYHDEVEAVGVCKACGRGLCRGCSAEAGSSIACASRCEDRARTVDELMDRNIRIMPLTEQAWQGYPRRQVAAAVMALVAGILFVMVGVDMRGTGRLGITGIGLIAIVTGVRQFAAASALKRVAKP